MLGNENSPEKKSCSIAGRIFLSPALPLFFLLLGLAGLLLCLPRAQAVLVQAGEQLAGRELTREIWYARFSAWGREFLACGIPALLSWCLLSAYAKIRKLDSLGWPHLFAGLGLWVLLYNSGIAYERTQRILVIIAASAICALLLRGGGKLRLSGHVSTLLRTVLPALAAVILASLFIDKGHTWGDDFAEYIAQAKILATGQDNPARPQVGYKYGTALLLFPFYLAKNFDLLALKIPMILCFAAFIAAISFFYRKRMRPRTATAATFLLATSPALLCFVNNILSDIPFLLFSTLSVMCFYKIYSGQESRGKKCLSGIAAGFCVMYAYGCRFQGLVLLLAFACTEALLLLRKAFPENKPVRSWTASIQGNIPAHVCFYASFSFFYVLYKLLLPASPGRSDLGFLDSFSLKGLACNAAAYPFFFSDFFSCHGHCPKAVRIALYLAALPIIVLGAIRKGKEEAVSVVYSLGLLAVYVIWPGPRDFRFLFPILPFILLFAAYGYEGLKDTGLRRCYKVFALLVPSVFFCVMLCLGTGNLRRGRSGNYQAFSDEAQAAYNYIRENTGEDERIIFFKPRVLYLATGRVSAEAEEEQDGFVLQMNEYDYLLDFSGQYHGYPLPIKEGLPQGLSLEEAFSGGSFTLYRIVKPTVKQ